MASSIPQLSQSHYTYATDEPAASVSAGKKEPKPAVPGSAKQNAFTEAECEQIAIIAKKELPQYSELFISTLKSTIQRALKENAARYPSGNLQIEVFGCFMGKALVEFAQEKQEHAQLFQKLVQEMNTLSPDDRKRIGTIVADDDLGKRLERVQTLINIACAVFHETGTKTEAKSNL